MISLPKKINNIEFKSRFRHIEVENLVEKNLFEICNFLSTKYKKVNLITVSNEYKNYFSKKITLHGPKKFTFNSNRIIKYIICSIYLFFE